MPDTIKQTQLFRFDQMAVQVKDKVEPEKADVDRYVGLEHIDPESLKIRRWGEPSDVESSKILFRSGDIIFGKRRAYQRKLAVADFDGICSAHAMVLRPKTDVVLEEFLPFFMQSDIFMDRAVKISVGGLSPTINWRDLAKEEFALPPLDEQRRVAEVLQAIRVSIDCLSELLDAITNLEAAFLEFGLDPAANRWTLATIGERFDVASGGTPSRNRPEYWDGDVPWLTTTEVAFELITKTAESITEEGLANSSAKLIPPKSVVIALFGATRGRSAITAIPLCTNQACASLLPNDGNDTDFTAAWIKREHDRLKAQGRGAAQPNLNLTIIRNHPFPVASRGQQQKCSVIWASVVEGKKATIARIDETRIIKKRLLAKMLA
jgi:type I restriction enzyme, S subunit